MVAKAVSEVWPAERTELPGAEIHGACAPAFVGPRDEKEAMASVEVVAPTEMVPAEESAGDPMVRHDGPELAAAKTGITPAACHALTTELNQVCPPVPPHELELTSGAWEQSGLFP